MNDVCSKCREILTITGITGNEKADQAAKSALNLRNITSYPPLPYSDITSSIKQESCAIAKMTARDARYISRSCAVAEIWPLEITQDGGGRHLGFVRTVNSAIRSAVPKNPTLEQNMKWIGRPVAEISPLEIFLTWRWPPSWICSNRK